MPRLVHHSAVTLLLSSCSLAAADWQAAPCYRAALQNPPSWITSGAWDRGKQRLLMVDLVNNRVVSYNLLSEWGTSSNLGRDLRPVKIARPNDGILLELADGSVLDLDWRLAETGRNFAAKLSPTTKTSSLYQWYAVARGSFVAFAAVIQEGVQPTTSEAISTRFIRP